MPTFRVPVALWAIASLELVLGLVASRANWPAQFGTNGSSPDGTAQWLLKGTALSAPLPFLIAMCVVGLLATRPGILGFAADILAALLAAFTIVASLGETFAATPHTTPRVVLVASGFIGLAAATLIAWAVAHDLRLRRRLRAI